MSSPDTADPTPSRAPRWRAPRRRLRRALVWTGSALGGLVVLAVVALLVYANVGVMTAEPGPLQAVRDDPAIVLDDSGDTIVMRPADGASDVGLVFIPGAKVDPLAYAAKLSGIVADDKLTVVITRPTLNLAFFDLRPLSSFTAEAPEVTTWLVGGHSLGGVKACQLAQDAAGLVLFGSYCATDLSGSGLPVLSIAGSDDGLSTPQKIADARHLLPATAELVEIDGASHASFGDYGPQAGDGTATISDRDMTTRLTELIAPVAASLG